MALSGIKLTIAIPTYNRDKYLDRCLENIFLQIGGHEDEVEIIVSDNASTDNTYQVIEKYKAEGRSIKYFRNEQNMGPDYNIYQCYDKANGNYVLALGDDDLLIDTAIVKIVNVIDTGTYGLIYLNSTFFTDDVSKSFNNDSKGYLVYDDHFSFLRKVNINITFISGNIINKSFFLESDMQQRMGTFLAQVDFILTALFLSSQNCFINDKILAVQSDNSGSYNLVKVFSENFNDIITKFEVRRQIKNIKEIIDNRLLILFFPYYILKLRSGNHNFVANDNFYSLKKLYNRYKSYWLFTYPMIKLPLIFAKIYFVFVRFCRKTLITFNNTFIDKGVLKQFGNL